METWAACIAVDDVKKKQAKRIAVVGCVLAALGACGCRRATMMAFPAIQFLCRTQKETWIGSLIFTDMECRPGTMMVDDGVFRSITHHLVGLLAFCSTFCFGSCRR